MHHGLGTLFQRFFPRVRRNTPPSTSSRWTRFLEQNPTYLSTQIIDDLRKTEYSRLDQNQEVYLDYTGGSLYSERHLQEHFESLKNDILGNPHSTNPSSRRATLRVEETRSEVLRFFNAEEDYFCVFTANASGALKIIGESYPFSEKSELLLSYDNHNSVNGLREFARSKGARFSYIPLQTPDLSLDPEEVRRRLETQTTPGSPTENRLFAFPAQSNVSGVKHPLEWIEVAQSLGWDVLLDAAAFVPTNPLDLQKVRPNFVSLSFYKMFGYPTGIGALLIRKSSFQKLQKPWFAGGTVQLVSVKADQYFLTANHEKFEDGTLDYLGIPAVSMGLRHIERISIQTIQNRVKSLSRWVHSELSSLRHSNGAPVVRVFGPESHENRGGNLILNFFEPNGAPIPFHTIESQANARKISLRTGCFCNPGIDEINHCLSTEELSDYFKHHRGGNYQDMMDFLGKLRGAVRISFGIASNWDDAEAFIEFAREQIR